MGGFLDTIPLLGHLEPPFAAARPALERMAFVNRGFVHGKAFPLICGQKRGFCLRTQPGDLGPIAALSRLGVERRQFLHQQSSQLERLGFIHGTQFAQPL